MDSKVLSQRDNTVENKENINNITPFLQNQSRINLIYLDYLFGHSKAASDMHPIG